MEEDEHKYFNEHEIGLGDIYEYRNIILERSKSEIDRISKQYKDEMLTSEVTEKLLNKKIEDMNRKLQNVKFIDPSNMIDI